MSSLTLNLIKMRDIILRIAVSSILLFGMTDDSPRKAPEGLETQVMNNVTKCEENAPTEAKKPIIRGKASHYGGNYKTQRKMANGDYYHPGKYTAAMTNVPLGTMVRVKNLQNGKVVEVEVTDRGPFVKGRVIDLSVIAAEALDIIHCGITDVEVTVMS